MQSPDQHGPGTSSGHAVLHAPRRIPRPPPTAPSLASADRLSLHLLLAELAAFRLASSLACHPRPPRVAVRLRVAPEAVPRVAAHVAVVRGRGVAAVLRFERAVGGGHAGLAIRNTLGRLRKCWMRGA